MLFSRSGPPDAAALNELLVDIIETRDPEASIPTTLRRLTEGSAHVALGCVWLFDAAASDEVDAEASPSRSVHLIATAGPAPLDSSFEEAFRRMPIKGSLMTRVLAHHNTSILDGTSFDWPARAIEWARSAAVQGFYGHRLSARDEVLGAMGLFLASMPGTDYGVLHLVASQLGMSLANERMWRELRRLKRDAQSGNDAARPSGKPVLSEADVRRLERENILAALEATGGRVYGRGGAAQLLGLKPTTLASRLKKLGISIRPSNAS